MHNLPDFAKVLEQCEITPLFSSIFLVLLLENMY